MAKHANGIGAGLVGCTLATLLARRGYQVDLYERAPDTRRESRIDVSRSINLALSARGLHALGQLGLAEEALAHSIPMPGRIIHDSRGEVEFQPYGLEAHECLHSISRQWLAHRLQDAAEQAGVRLHFQHRACGLQTVCSPDGSERTLAAPVFATDGAYSGVRPHLIAHARVDYSQTFLPYGYKELTIPAGPDGAYAMDKGGLHIWPRDNFMLIALPDPGGSFTGTLFAPYSVLDDLHDPEPFFARHFPDALALLPDLREQWAHPTGAMVTIRLNPWHWRGDVLLLGDAAHAIVPFFGQGMNCGLEDCSVLMELLEEEPDWEATFRRFQELRKPNCDAIGELSLANLEEMQGKTDSAHFLRCKAIEKELERSFPGEYVSAYSMIAHHRVPYHLAQQAGQLQQEILEQLARESDLSLARTRIEERLGSLMERARPYLVD